MADADNQPKPQFKSYKDLIQSSSSSSSESSDLEPNKREEGEMSGDRRSYRSDSKDSFSSRSEEYNHSRYSRKRTRSLSRSYSRSRSRSHRRRSYSRSYSRSHSRSRSYSRSRSRSSSCSSYSSYSSSSSSSERFRPWIVPKNPLLAAYSGADRPKKYKRIKHKWEHDIFKERSKQDLPSPKRPKEPYIPEEPTWISKAGGVAIFPKRD